MVESFQAGDAEVYPIFRIDPKIKENGFQSSETKFLIIDNHDPLIMVFLDIIELKIFCDSNVWSFALMLENSDAVEFRRKFGISRIFSLQKVAVRLPFICFSKLIFLRLVLTLVLV